MFCQDYVEFDNGPGIFPAAIVETLEGQIYTVCAEYVSFAEVTIDKVKFSR
jgi:hypothetical protein